MTNLPRRKIQLLSQYDDEERIKNSVAKGHHRNLVGAMFDEVGDLQRDFLIAQGMKASDKVLDIGCGVLRAGVKIIPKIDSGNYFGIDASKTLLDVGHNRELAEAGLKKRLPRANLYCSKLFKHNRLNPATIDLGICVSVFTHLPINFLRVCLANAAVYFKPGARLFVSFFELPDGLEFAQPYRNEQGITTSGFRDPYHYYRADMTNFAIGTPWKASYLGNWAHPRGQKMMCYTRM